MKDVLHYFLTAYFAIAGAVSGICMALLIGTGHMTLSVDAVPQSAACLLVGALWPAIFAADQYHLQALAQVVVALGV